MSINMVTMCAAYTAAFSVRFPVLSS